LHSNYPVVYAFKLPRYTTTGELRQHLIQAIQSDNPFIIAQTNQKRIQTILSDRSYLPDTNNMELFAFELSELHYSPSLALIRVMVYGNKLLVSGKFERVYSNPFVLYLKRRIQVRELYVLFWERLSYYFNDSDDSDDEFDAEEASRYFRVLLESSIPSSKSASPLDDLDKFINLTSDIILNLEWSPNVYPLVNRRRLDVSK
jgi:hypothetical protein